MLAGDVRWLPFQSLEVHYRENADLFFHHHPNFIPRVHQLKHAQCAAWFFGRMQQPPIPERECILVQLAAQNTVVDAGGVQRVGSMWAIRFKQVAFAEMLHQ